jgi:SH3-like domain-containing protein
MVNVYESNSTRHSSVPAPAIFPVTWLRSSLTFWRSVLLLLAALLLVACGPEQSASSEEQLVTAVQAIAQEYAAAGNLEQARTQLDALQVANPTQWLVYVTEMGIQQQMDATLLAALVKLTQDLGLTTAAITAYGVQNKLLPGAQLAQEPAVAAQAAVAQAAATQAPTEAPTAAPVEATTAVTATTASAAPTNTPQPAMAKASDMINVRGGPGTEYALAGALQKDELVQIVGKNPQGNWWQVQLSTGAQGWVLGELVEALGDTASIAVAANIPAAPTAAPTVAQVAEAPATATQAPAAAPAEAAATTAPAAPAATEAPATTATPDPNAAPHFTLVSKRLWNKDENDGCVGKHLLRIHVLDAAGNRLNGIRLKGIYTGHELVTGEQGKGDGVIEFDLHGSGEGFKVIRNNDGREATSDPAEGFTTRSLDIPEETLIATGYCTNHDDCQIFYNSFGCQGHHSWEATFQRNY